MATFTRVQGNLTADEAREVGRGTSFQEADYYLDGREPIRVTTSVPADLIEANMADNLKDKGNTVRFGSLLNNPDIAQDVVDHEKASLLARKRAGAIDSSIRDRPNAPGGQTWEWDHWQLSLTREETAWLAANPDREAEFREIVAEGMRAHPSATGTRQALITDIHKDTGAWHIQGLVSRYAMDYSVNPPRASTAVDLSNNSAAVELIRRIQDRFNDAGMPINVGRLYTNERAPDGQPRSKLEDRRTSDAAKEAYRADVEAAGGVPGARSTVGAEPEAPATARAIQGIVPEVEKLELGARLAEDDGLKAAQRVEALRAELEAAEAARQAAAERRATFDQAIAAIGQRQAAEAAQKAAQEAAQAAQEALDAVQAQAAADAAQAAQEATIAAESIMRAEDRADLAERLATERYARIEDLEANAVGEPGRIADAVAAEVDPLRVELESAHTHAAGEPQRQANALHEALSPIQQQVDQLRAELEAERVARQNADKARNDVMAELAREREGFAERLATAVRDAVRDAEARMQTLFDRLIERLQPQPAQAALQPVGMPPKGQEFYRTTPDRWNFAQRAQAEADLGRRAAKDPAAYEGRTVERHGELAHDAWRARNAAPRPGKKDDK